MNRCSLLGALLLFLMSGATILAYVGFMHVSASVSPAVQQQTQPPLQPTPTAQSFTVLTSDQQFTITLTVTPNHTGPNVFSVSVMDITADTLISYAHISLSTIMLDMRMGTETVILQPDGKGHFSAKGNLPMGGDWGIHISIRTPDNILHEAYINLLTPG
jgi:copper transport protein